MKNTRCDCFDHQNDNGYGSSRQKDESNTFLILLLFIVNVMYKSVFVCWVFETVEKFAVEMCFIECWDGKALVWLIFVITCGNL